MTFFGYSKCSTCRNAKKWLDNNNIAYEERDMKTSQPTYEELKNIYEKSGMPIKKLFNTSGNVYKELSLKDKIDSMTDEECLKLLATDGMLVKRPLVDGKKILIGFKETEWKESF